MKIVKSLNYKGEKIDYTLVLRENQRSYRIRNDNDKIVVSAPQKAPIWEVELFIYKHLEKFIKLVNLKKQYIKYEIGNPGFIKIWNKSVPTFFQPDATVKSPENVFRLYEEKDKTVKHMYKKLALLYTNFFKQRVDHWKSIMNLEYKNLTVKEVKSKWGVCYPQTSKIVLNIRLIHYPIECLDSVIIHELAHLVYPNHSRDFKYYILKYCPNYKTYNDLLKI